MSSVTKRFLSSGSAIIPSHADNIQLTGKGQDGGAAYTPITLDGNLSATLASSVDELTVVGYGNKITENSNVGPSFIKYGNPAQNNSTLYQASVFFDSNNDMYHIGHNETSANAVTIDGVKYYRIFKSAFTQTDDVSQIVGYIPLTRIGYIADNSLQVIVDSQDTMYIIGCYGTSFVMKYNLRQTASATDYTDVVNAGRVAADVTLSGVTLTEFASYFDQGDVGFGNRWNAVTTRYVYVDDQHVYFVSKTNKLYCWNLTTNTVTTIMQLMPTYVGETLRLNSLGYDSTRRYLYVNSIATVQESGVGVTHSLLYRYALRTDTFVCLYDGTNGVDCQGLWNSGNIVVDYHGRIYLSGLTTSDTPSLAFRRFDPNTNRLQSIADGTLGQTFRPATGTIASLIDLQGRVWFISWNDTTNGAHAYVFDPVSNNGYDLGKIVDADTSIGIDLLGLHIYCMGSHSSTNGNQSFIGLIYTNSIAPIAFSLNDDTYSVAGTYNTAGTVSADTQHIDISAYSRPRVLTMIAGSLGGTETYAFSSANFTTYTYIADGTMALSRGVSRVILIGKGQDGSTDGATPVTGSPVSVVIGSTTYTLPGGSGGAASTTQIVIDGLDPTIENTIAITVPSGGTLTVKHPVSDYGTDSTATIGSTVYTFPGGRSGAAAATVITPTGLDSASSHLISYAIATGGYLELTYDISAAYEPILGPSLFMIPGATARTDGSAAQWAQTTAIIPGGYLCVNTDTGEVKLGDGTTTYSQLPVITTAKIPQPLPNALLCWDEYGQLTNLPLAATPVYVFDQVFTSTIQLTVPASTTTVVLCGSAASTSSHSAADIGGNTYTFSNPITPVIQTASGLSTASTKTLALTIPAGGSIQVQYLYE